MGFCLQNNSIHLFSEIVQISLLFKFGWCGFSELIDPIKQEPRFSNTKWHHNFSSETYQIYWIWIWIYSSYKILILNTVWKLIQKKKNSIINKNKQVMEMNIWNEGTIFYKFYYCLNGEFSMLMSFFFKTGTPSTDSENIIEKWNYFSIEKLKTLTFSVWIHLPFNISMTHWFIECVIFICWGPFFNLSTSIFDASMNVPRNASKVATWNVGCISRLCRFHSSTINYWGATRANVIKSKI